MSLHLSASAAAPALRSGRVTTASFYDELRARFDKELKFAQLFPGTAPPPALTTGPAPGAPAGALAGIAFVVSPDIDVAGAATHAGADALRAAVADADAAAVAALKAAGAHLLGQTTGAELGLAIAYATAGVAKNPYSKCVDEAGRRLGRRRGGRRAGGRPAAAPARRA